VPVLVTEVTIRRFMADLRGLSGTAERRCGLAREAVRLNMLFTPLTTGLEAGDVNA